MALLKRTPISPKGKQKGETHNIIAYNQTVDPIVDKLNIALSTMTAANAGAINSGDAGTDAVIANNRTRISEIEAILVSLFNLTHS